MWAEVRDGAPRRVARFESPNRGQLTSRRNERVVGVLRLVSLRAGVLAANRLASR